MNTKLASKWSVMVLLAFLGSWALGKANEPAKLELEVASDVEILGSMSNGVLRITMPTNYLFAPHLDAAAILKLARDSGEMTNMVRLLVVTGEFCWVHGHTWFESRKASGFFAPSETRTCAICGAVQERHMPPWPGEEYVPMPYYIVTNMPATNVVVTNYIIISTNNILPIGTNRFLSPWLSPDNVIPLGEGGFFYPNSR